MNAQRNQYARIVIQVNVVVAGGLAGVNSDDVEPFKGWECLVEQCGYSIKSDNIEEIVTGAVEHWNKYHEDEME